MLRGYAQLKRENSIGLGRLVKSALADQSLPGITEGASPLIFGAATGNAERVVRQYLFERHIGIAMNRAILYALGSKSAVVFALPPVWRQVLTNHGLNMNTTASAVAWRWSLFLRFGRNIQMMGKTLMCVLAAQVRVIPKDRYVYFDGLVAGNLPQPNQARPSYDICSWYAKWDGRSPDIATIRHSVPVAQLAIGGVRVESIAEPFLLLRGIPKVMRLWAWCCVATLFATFEMFRGRWWYAILLTEATRAKAVALCDPEVLAVDYLHHFSGNMYRPLWTYEAERKGARILCYFYSTFEQHKLKTGYESQKYEWGSASWPHYMVWDKYQEAQLRRDMGSEPKISVVGPIWFSEGCDMLALPSRYVAVFDVEPPRPSAAFPFSTMGDYIAANPDFSERFLNDIQQVLGTYGLVMAFKKKREIGNKGSKKYKKLIERLSENSNVTIIPPELSPMQLIEHSVAVISMPFTSTALYSNNRIPTIYYDPTCWIQHDDRAAHGVRVIIGKKELTKWISEIMNRINKN
jgi:polysaccharide biosynthesis PFTS motif protein